MAYRADTWKIEINFYNKVVEKKNFLISIPDSMEIQNTIYTKLEQSRAEQRFSLFVNIFSFKNVMEKRNYLLLILWKI